MTDAHTRCGHETAWLACSSTISRFDVFARIQSDACREKQGARIPELGTRNYLRIIAGLSRSEERFAVLLKARQQPDYFRVTFLLSKLQRRAATRNTQQSEVSCSFYSVPLIALQASTARSDELPAVFIARVCIGLAREKGGGYIHMSTLRGPVQRSPQRTVACIHGRTKSE